MGDNTKYSFRSAWNTDSCSVFQTPRGISPIPFYLAVGDAFVCFLHSRRGVCGFGADARYAYDPENRINEYDLTLFLKEGDTYRKSEEIHYQRAYTLREVRKAVRESGMEFLKAVDEEGYGPVSRRTERMFILAKEKGKREY